MAFPFFLMSRLGFRVNDLLCLSFRCLHDFLQKIKLLLFRNAPTGVPSGGQPSTLKVVFDNVIHTDHKKIFVKSQVSILSLH